jgi:hypothetical protein
MENLSLTYVSTLSGKDLVEKYNELTGKKITRFSSLLDGRKRVYEALGASSNTDVVEVEVAETVSEAEADAEANGEAEASEAEASEAEEEGAEEEEEQEEEEE